MNRFFTILFLIPCAIFAQENISVLTAGSGRSIPVKSDANINLAGLEMSPTSDFVISETDLTRSSTAIVSQYNESSVSRVYSSTNLVSNFVGSIAFNYDDDEINNLIESVLVLEVKNDNGLWESYTGLVDPSKNTVTVNFNSPISFNSITASQAGSTLTIENVNSVSDILIYPNPTADKIFIQYNSEILAQLYDVAGRRVISTNEKSINMNSFKSGTYMLKLTNEQNESHSFKIMKN
jgi:hypothetical protein